MTPSKCPFCGGLPRGLDLIDEFPIGDGRVNQLHWATCKECNEPYRQRTIRDKA